MIEIEILLFYILFLFRSELVVAFKWHHKNKLTFQVTQLQWKNSLWFDILWIIIFSSSAQVILTSKVNLSLRSVFSLNLLCNVHAKTGNENSFTLTHPVTKNSVTKKIKLSKVNLHQRYNFLVQGNNKKIFWLMEGMVSFDQKIIFLFLLNFPSTMPDWFAK